jgi:hypothetical protein
MWVWLGAVGVVFEGAGKAGGVCFREFEDLGGGKAKEK